MRDVVTVDDNERMTEPFSTSDFGGEVKSEDACDQVSDAGGVAVRLPSTRRDCPVATACSPSVRTFACRGYRGGVPRCHESPCGA
jgi:hypothetical protein